MKVGVADVVNITCTNTYINFSDSHIKLSSFLTQYWNVQINNSKLKVGGGGFAEK